MGMRKGRKDQKWEKRRWIERSDGSVRTREVKEYPLMFIQNVALNWKILLYKVFLC